jgi:hypothetical protein
VPKKGETHVLLNYINDGPESGLSRLDAANKEDGGYGHTMYWFGLSHQYSNLKVLLKDAIWLNRSLVLGGVHLSPIHNNMVSRRSNQVETATIAIATVPRCAVCARISISINIFLYTQ